MIYYDSDVIALTEKNMAPKYFVRLNMKDMLLNAHNASGNNHNKCNKDSCSNQTCDKTRPIAISRVLLANSDGRTNGPTDEAAYRVACERLKNTTQSHL